MKTNALASDADQLRCVVARIEGKTLIRVVAAAILCLLVVGLPRDARAAETEANADNEAQYVTESLRGKVVWTADVLRRRYGVETDPDADHWSVSLETADGKVHPLVKDARGRGFLIDKRLRDRDLELFVRRYLGSPFIQVIRVYTFKDGRKYEFDYWCDICAIAMYELKECECCQGPIRFRERLVEESAK